MPSNKDLKRLVRARMNKTGEAYTAARAQITSKPRAKTASPVAAPAPTPKNHAELAGMSDASISSKTGFTWEQWERELDKHDAAGMKHGDIAALVNKTWHIDGWWSQSVTVGYERIKGLRARGQRRDGSYEANKSRTFSVPVKTLFDAWASAAMRKRWLNEPGVKVRTATSPKSMRLGWSDGSIIAVGFYPKGKGKSMVALAHTKLPDKAAADRFKKYWTERLAALGDALA